MSDVISVEVRSIRGGTESNYPLNLKSKLLSPCISHSRRLKVEKARERSTGVPFSISQSNNTFLRNSYKRFKRGNGFSFCVGLSRGERYWRITASIPYMKLDYFTLGF